MKKSILLTFVFTLLFGAASFAQTNTQKPANVAAFQWLQAETKDFGKIPQGNPVTATFKFKNTGKIPLVISNVQASCGCTTPDYSKAPIAPGETGFVMATFNAASSGTFTKSVTVTANVEGGSAVLYLKGEVETKSANQ
ncbi:MAG: DUF1573 domain-containing protein [Thermoflexibacter sp.]|jgi:hypothetical protein|nr:DUF1573 domain-containing protein [Thermoflexibacter sp.]